LNFHLAALALREPALLSTAETFLVLSAHVLGLGILAQVTRTPLFWALLVPGVLFAARFLPPVRRVLSPALLAPLFFVYLALAVRFLWLRVLQGQVPGYFEDALPDLRVLLQFVPLVAAALVYADLILLALLLRSRARAPRAATVILAAGVLVWAAWTYLSQRTAGATGSDPYAYVQMALDLAQHGTAAHRFELFSLVVNSRLAWYPVLPVGYRLPFDPQGDAITVWPMGGAVAYALAYRLGGEGALYLVNPFSALLGAIVAGLLACELTRGASRTMRLATAGLTLAAVATSNEIVNWAGVTMVDTQALALTAGAFLCAVRVYRTRSLGWAIGAGVLWGAAYLVRHTQLVVGAALLPPILFVPTTRQIKLRNMVALGAAALAVALPDLWYHQMYLGNWSRPESEELALYSLDAISRTLPGLGQSFLSGGEFGWLAPAIVAGVILYTHREPVMSAALGLWLAVALAVHLPYAALRWRDLIPELPVVAFYAAIGVTAGIAALWHTRRVWATPLAASLLFLALELGFVRVWNTLPRALELPLPRFGVMTQAQRGAFEQLAALTPVGSVIGASLNAGAVELYAQRAAFRPADWSSAEFDEFLRLARDQRREIYLLEDNASLAPVLDHARASFRVERVTSLDVPLFGDATVAEPGTLWHLEP
jgi:hypothetical protein